MRKSADHAEFQSSSAENRRNTAIQVRGVRSLVFDARIGLWIGEEINGAARPLPEDAAKLPDQRQLAELSAKEKRLELQYRLAGIEEELKKKWRGLNAKHTGLNDVHPGHFDKYT
ncbi:MAG: hypothetical protein LUO85_03655 [Methanomassiliicoccales archaeon]|nr:hypothetical protein [Methanomassiliicoccales archaeon]